MSSFLPDDRGSLVLYHGSARHFIFVRVAMLWIACCVAASFYFAFEGYLELTVVWGTMALCLSPSVWIYLGLLELRQVCQMQMDQINSFRQRVGELQLKSAQPPSSVEVTSAPTVVTGSPMSPEPNGNGAALPGADLVRAQLPPAKNPALPAVETLKVKANGSSRQVHNGHANGSGTVGLTNIVAPPGHRSEELTVAGLRVEFAALVRAERFIEALHVGDQIAEHFPESRSAREFNQLRSYLLGRAGLASLQPAPV